MEFHIVAGDFEIFQRYQTYQMWNFESTQKWNPS